MIRNGITFDQTKAVNTRELTREQYKKLHAVLSEEYNPYEEDRYHNNGYPYMVVDKDGNIFHCSLTYYRTHFNMPLISLDDVLKFTGEPTGQPHKDAEYFRAKRKEREDVTIVKIVDDLLDMCENDLIENGQVTMPDEVTFDVSIRTELSNRGFHVSRSSRTISI
jgi:hypothetical protein